MRAQRLHDVAAGGRAFEHHVFQQVGHAGFAVVFILRAHFKGDIHRHRGFRIVGNQQYQQPVIELIRGNAFHGRALLNSLGQGLREQSGGKRRRGYRY